MVRKIEDSYAYEMQKFIGILFDLKEVKVKTQVQESILESFEAFNDEICHVDMKEIDLMTLSCKI
ncbi:MAG: hypothetical protein ACFFDI_31185 [Promethearchaeota archaeon]